MTESDNKLCAYRTLVEKMFDEQSAELISNRDTQHARVLIETMIDRAKSSLDFFCRDLNAKVYGERNLASKIVAAGLRGVKIRILSQEKPESNLMELLLPWFPNQDKVIFRQASEGSDSATADYNFVIMDQTAFRFETDREKHVATASANNPSVAAKISRRFEEFWESQSVPAGVDV